MPRPLLLPSERNPSRVRSHYLKALDKAYDACEAYRANPNPGTYARRADRLLAFLAQRARLRFVLAYHRTDLHGAARWSVLRKTARAYLDAKARWSDGYDTASGWSAKRRTLRTYERWARIEMV